MAELPLVVIDVQRSGPSTGLPTKTEQTDLMQALYGRNGESPLCVVAPQSPTDCFDMAFEASRIALEHMTPVILLSDAFIGNGSSAWRVPDNSEYPEINAPILPAEKADGTWKPYERNSEGVRYWAIPGTEGAMHRLGGLEKDARTSVISNDPVNHENMVLARKQKVANIAKDIPMQEVYYDDANTADTLLVGWGGTYGHLRTAAAELNEQGVNVAFTHLRYINPLPRNFEEIMSKYKRVIVAELNTGMLADYLQSIHPASEIFRINKIQGQPFMVSELVSKVKEILK
jgi:2-oxoglutarate ferredoxin oxidoreductase subunit alpha